MADEAPKPILTHRDVINIARGAFADLAAVLGDPTIAVDPRWVLQEMDRIAQFIAQMPIPQAAETAPEARPN